jgi:peptidoglycan/LPS O-acetylase OafA/YrhL
VGLLGRRRSEAGARARFLGRTRATSARSDARTTSRLGGVEGLRGTAATSILLYHVWLYSQPGPHATEIGPLTRFVLPHLPLGVTLFFTLSGFLLYRPIVAAIVDGTPQPRVGPYFVNRGLRILPAYWAVLACTAVLLPAATLRTGPDSLTLGRMAHDPALLMQNAILLQNYRPESLLTGITPAWSLAVEVVFYLALPLLGLLALACAPRRRDPRARLAATLVPAALMLVIGLSGRAAADRLVASAGTPNPGWDGDWHSVVVRSFWAQADLFTFGMALAVLLVAVERDLLALPRWWRRSATAAAVAAFVGISLLADQKIWSPGDQVYDLTGELGCGLLLALVVLPAPVPGAHPPFLVRVLTTRPAILVGLSSYSIFLWHEPLVRLLRAQGWTFAGKSGLILNFVLVAVVTLVAATATYRLVERPALRHKRRTTEHVRGHAPPSS